MATCTEAKLTERSRKISLDTTLVQLSDVMALMIAAQRAVLRNDREEARMLVTDAVSILNGMKSLPLT